jgi:Uma2 family endonuclease
MATGILESPVKTLADVLHELGDIPLERIRFPVGGATEDDVVKHLEASDKRIYELIDGVLVEKPMGMRESIIASICSHHLWDYLDQHDRGVAFSADGPIRIKPGRIRFPDTGFVSWERIPNQELPDEPILDAVPNLAVEVISKSNTAREMELKLKDYFQAGVQLAWLIYPKSQTVEVTSPTSKKTFTKEQTLDGGKILSGFKLPVKKLFARTQRRTNGRQRGNGAR